MLWIPGPTEVREELNEELTRPMIGHRTRAMAELHDRIDPHLRLAFGLAPGSTAKVAVGTHSATALMEASLRGVGDRVLSVVNGAFSKRWRDIAALLGKDVRTIEVEWGRAVTGEALEKALAKDPCDAVTLVLNETSTGVRTPLEPVSSVLRGHQDTLLLVDVVSALAGYPVDFDHHGIDFALAGVQKALALPPGISVMCASEDYMASALSRDRGSYYLDPVRTIEGHESRKTPVTPCIPLYRALARQLEDISNGITLPERDRGRRGEDAWRARYEKHERLRERTLAWGAGHGLGPFPARDLSSPTITCFRADSVDVEALLAGLKQRGHEIGNGYGPLKGETFRIGHMGDHTEEGLAKLLAAADDVLAT